MSGNIVLSNSFQDHIDSLKHEVLTNTNTPFLISRFLKIGHTYIGIDNDSAIYYTNKSIELARNTNNLNGIANGYFILGNIYYITEEYEKALKSNLLALEIYLQKKNLYFISATYTNLGVLYSLGYDKQKAIDYYIKSIEISQQLKDSAGIAGNLNNIGLIYQNLMNYDKAIEYFTQTLEIDTQLGNLESIAHSYNNIGNLYLDKKLYDKAYGYLIEAYNRINQLENIDLKIENLTCLGEYYLEINESDSALKFIKKTMEVASNAKRKNFLAYNYSLMGRYFLGKENYSSSIAYFNKAISLSDLLDIKDIGEYYEFLSKTYFKKSDFYNAYLNIEKSYAIGDSLNAYEVGKKLNEFERQIELVKIQNEFQLEQYEKQSELTKKAVKMKLLVQFSILIIVFLIAIVIIIIKSSRTKAKANKYLTQKNEIIELQSEELQSSISQLVENEKELKLLNATKDKFFSIIAHDLKNPFNVLIGYADLLITEPSFKKDAQKLDQILASIHNTTEYSYSLLENLLTWARSQSGSLKVHPQNFNLSELISSNSHYFKEMANAKKIELKFECKDALEVYADQNMVYTILRNLINNAVKFTKPDGCIEVIANQEENIIKVSVSDNGIGINKEVQEKLFRIDSDFKTKGTANETGTGLGLILCDEFIKLNSGKIFVVSEEGKGSTFTFTLPITQT